MPSADAAVADDVVVPDTLDSPGGLWVFADGALQTLPDGTGAIVQKKSAWNQGFNGG
jgi:hypothetical protein